MNTLLVGVGSRCVSNDPIADLVAHALGCCVAIAVYGPATYVGGQLRCMLPASSLDPVRAARTPYLFAVEEQDKQPRCWRPRTSK